MTEQDLYERLLAHDAARGAAHRVPYLVIGVLVYLSRVYQWVATGQRLADVSTATLATWQAADIALSTIAIVSLLAWGFVPRRGR